MSFRLKGGKLYLDDDPESGLSYDAFKELLTDGFKGIVVSASDEEKVRSNVEGDFDFKRIVAKDEKTHLRGLDELEECLNALPRKSAVLLDNLDELVVDHGFEETLSFIYRLRDRSHLNGHVVLLSLDSERLNKIEHRLIEKETNGSRLKD